MKKETLQFTLIVIILTLFFGIGLSHAEFAPPTLLPGDNESVSGFGDACVNLADRIRTGEIHLTQIPCFIKYFAKTLIALAGTLSVIFVMIGGYKYILQGVEKKDEAKKTIRNALIGLAVSLSAWILTDIVLQLITE